MQTQEKIMGGRYISTFKDYKTHYEFRIQSRSSITVILAGLPKAILLACPILTQVAI